MLINDYGNFDTLSYVDETTAEERAYVEQLIRQELNRNREHQEQQEQQQDQHNQEQLHQQQDQHNQEQLHQQQLHQSHLSHHQQPVPVLSDTHAGTHHGTHPGTHPGPEANTGFGYPPQNPQHPLVDQILPLQPSRSAPLLLREIERYEHEQDEEHKEYHEDRDMSDGSTQTESIIQGGIDMSRYTEFYDPDSSSAPSSILYNRLYSTLSHSILEERSLTLASDQHEHITRQQRRYIEKLRGIRDLLEADIGTKRERMDDINQERKRRQTVDFKPVNDYLEQRWRDGIENVLELGIETALESEKDIE